MAKTRVNNTKSKRGRTRTHGNTRSESFTKLSDITGHAFSTAGGAVVDVVDSAAASPSVRTAAAFTIVFVSSAAAVSSVVAALRDTGPPPPPHFFVPWMSSCGGAANALTVTTEEEDVIAMTNAAEKMKNFIMGVWLWFWVLHVDSYVLLVRTDHVRLGVRRHCDSRRE